MRQEKGSGGSKMFASPSSSLQPFARLFCDECAVARIALRTLESNHIE